MLSNTLVTNEIKNAAGTEEEFLRLQFSDGRSTVFQRSGEQPAYPHRMSIQHTESGVGTAKRRRSTIRFDKTVIGQVDTTASMKGSAYIVLDAPVGQMTSSALITDVIANLVSFMASLGASTTILYDGTGNGAATLISGGL